MNDGAVRWLALILALAQRMPEVKLYERKIMKKTKFTMLGMTGSGKTCYLLGMYKKCWEVSRDFRSRRMMIPMEN